MSTETHRAELIQFLKDYACGGSNYNDKLLATAAMLDSQAAEIAALKAENEALRKDAERYRWLRANPTTLRS